MQSIMTRLKLLLAALFIAVPALAQAQIDPSWQITGVSGTPTGSGALVLNTNPSLIGLTMGGNVGLGANHLSYGGTAAGLSFNSANLMQASAGASITSTSLTVPPLSILSNVSAGGSQTAIKFSDIAGTGGWLIGRSLNSDDANDFFLYNVTDSAARLTIAATTGAVSTNGGSLTAGAISGTVGAFTSGVSVTKSGSAQVTYSAINGNDTAEFGIFPAGDGYVSIDGMHSFYTHVNGNQITQVSSTGLAVTGTTSSTSFADSGGHLLISSTAPTIASGFGTSPSILANNTAAFQVTAGSGGTSYQGELTMPAATNGWACTAHELGVASSEIQQTATSGTDVQVANYNSTTGANYPWGVGSKILFQCTAF